MILGNTSLPKDFISAECVGYDVYQPRAEINSGYEEIRRGRCLLRDVVFPIP